MGDDHTLTIPGGDGATPGAGRATRAGAALGLLLFTVFVTLRYLGVAQITTEEEHFRLGQHLHATGVLSIIDAPGVFRAPGFPAFAALVLHLRDALFPSVDDMRAVALAQGCLLGLGAVALFLHASRTHPVPVALAVGALFAFHPLNLLMARILTYCALHIVLVTLATLAVSGALRTRGRPLHAAWILGAGIAWGLATLVRPVSLILPPFVLLLARWEWGRGSWRRAMRFACMFTLGMAVVIGPYTLRNYRATHRLIVVNAQEGYALWGLSQTRDPGGDIGEWVRLWTGPGDPIFRRVTGGAPPSLEALYVHAVAMNDAFRAEALRNIRLDPARFAGNVAWNMFAFNLDYTYRWVERFDHVREGWDWPPRVFVLQFVGWTVLLVAATGVVRGLRDGETDARLVAVTYCMFWAAHCLSILVPRYTYVRFPLVLVAFPLGLRGLEKAPVAGKVLLVVVIVATLSAWELSIP